MICVYNFVIVNTGNDPKPHQNGNYGPHDQIFGNRIDDLKNATIALCSLTTTLKAKPPTTKEETQCFDQ